MEWFIINDIIYHGTISLYSEGFRHGINLNKGDKNADFGKGFYTTSNYKQALAFATYQSNKYNSLQKKRNNKYQDFDPHYVNPMILKFNLDKGLLKNHTGIKFDLPDEKWAEFIYNNRLGIDFLISDNHNIDIKYEYVYGQIADSRIATIVENAREKRISFQEFFSQIMPFAKYSNQDQLSFHK